MHTVPLKKAIVRVLAFSLLLSFSGSGHGFVLCWGHDSHMHIEVTFNGVDCGHPPALPRAVKSNPYLKADASFSPAPCYSCTDIPLAFIHYVLKQHTYTHSPHNDKTAGAITALPVSHSTLIPHGLCPAQGPMVQLNSCSALNQIVSTALRI